MKAYSEKCPFLARATAAVPADRYKMASISQKNIEFLIQKNIRCPFLHKAEGAPKDDDKKVEDDKKSNKVVREVSEATKEDVIGVVEDKKSKKNITMKQVK